MRFDDEIKVNNLTVALLIIFWLICGSFYPSLPDLVPTHWNIQGQVDNYSHKAVATLIMPALPLFIYILMTFLPKLDPQRKNYQKFASTYNKIRAAIVFVMMLITLLPLLAALGYNLDVSLTVRLIISLLFIFIGNYIGKIRYNYFTGIRVPWTLASEEVWQKTHRMGGKLMVAGGLIALLALPAPPTGGFIITMAGLFLPLVLTIVYSYVLYKKLV
ncbi:SdpI family protein [Desulfotomaculum varum]